MKEFIKVNSIAIVTKLLGAFFSLLSISFLTRILNKSEYGKYVLLSSTINIFAVIFFQWVAVVTSRYLTLNPKYILAYVRNKILIMSWILITFSLLLYIFLEDIRILIIGFTGVSFGIYNVKLQIENSLERWSSYNYLLLSKYIFTFIFLLFFLYLYKSANFAIISLFIGLVLSILCNKKINYQLDLKDKVESKLFLFGITYTIILILNSIIDFADRYLIEYFKGYFSVGQYSANYDLTQQTLGGFLSVFAIYFTPKILKSKNQNNKKLFDKLNSRYLNFIFILGSFLVLNYFIAYPIISKVISEKYRYYSIFEIIFILLGILFSVIKGTVFDLNLQIEGKYKILIYNMFFIACVNVLLNILLIPKYDQVGAAFSTFTAFLSGTLISAYFSRKYLKLSLNFYLGVSEIVLIIAVLFCLNKYFISESYFIVFLKIIFFSAIFILSIITFNVFGVKSYVRLLKKKINIEN